VQSPIITGNNITFKDSSINSSPLNLSPIPQAPITSNISAQYSAARSFALSSPSACLEAPETAAFPKEKMNE
jgi:hypothetical protein